MRMCACRGTAGFAHVSCLAEQAKILFAEAQENNLTGTWHERWARWFTCSLCEQKYHGVVICALGWACWKTYLGRPEEDWARGSAMNVLGGGLSEAGRHEDALPVREAELAMMQRLGAPEHSILAAKSNLANSYQIRGRLEEALDVKRDAYSGILKLYGKEHNQTLVAAFNYSRSLQDLERFEEARSLLRKVISVARRVLGENHGLTLKLRWNYAAALLNDTSATLDDLREAVTTLEDAERTARRVLGGTHPTTTGIETALRQARATLRAREAEAVRVAECDSLQRDNDALERRLELLAAHEAAEAVQVAELDACRRDCDAIKLRLDATQARIAALDARGAEAIGK